MDQVSCAYPPAHRRRKVFRDCPMHIAFCAYWYCYYRQHYFYPHVETKPSRAKHRCTCTPPTLSPLILHCQHQYYLHHRYYPLHNRRYYVLMRVLKKMEDQRMPQSYHPCAAPSGLSCSYYCYYCHLQNCFRW